VRQEGELSRHLLPVVENSPKERSQISDKDKAGRQRTAERAAPSTYSLELSEVKTQEKGVSLQTRTKETAERALTSCRRRSLSER
jgi:hypothetical protein